MGLQRPWSLPSFHESWTLLVLSLVCFSVLWRIAEGDTSLDDVDGLHALLNSWGPMASSTLQWTGSDPCGLKWIGIRCDDSSPQRVISIELTGLGLAGELPPDISLLCKLNTLDLSYNNLTGSIPSQIGGLTHLDELSLQFNHFNGSIPLEIGQIKNLSTLSLNGNSLTGPIPNEIGLLQNLYWLDLAQNRLNGPLPYSSDGNSMENVGLDNLTRARHFHLNNNSFSGEIPGSMCHQGMSLIHLVLDSNQFTGIIPRGLGECGTLLIMKLNNNQLQGVIPNEIGLLTNLIELQLNDNQLVGPLPNLSNLTDLVVLELSNNELDVEFPPWIVSLKRLTYLIMCSASISGQIPASFFGLPALSDVRLANNRIDGTLDLSNGTCQLSSVSMGNNSITSFKSGNCNQTNLWLQGNPVCIKLHRVLSEVICSDKSSGSPPKSLNVISCSNTCPTRFQASPQCTCAIPYQGTLIYRAPLFTSLRNDSLTMLAFALASNLSVEFNKVVIRSASFNAQNQLIVDIAIFPNGTAISWSRDDVLRMASILGKKDGLSLPLEFGPPMFQQLSFVYDVGVSRQGTRLNTGAVIGISVGSAALVLIILGLGSFAFLQKRRADKAVELSRPFGAWRGDKADSGGAPKLKGAHLFSYAELEKASNNFSESNEIGSGGYGKVYRGILSSREQVAIKRAQGNSMQGAAEFKTEIELLSRVHHKNVVGLVGFCFERGERMLVYEYMAGGSLKDCLTGCTGMKLDWRRRIMIALGAARGIMYLHELVSPPIIHRDIKSTNILLDERKIAKVADFGLSKIGPREGSGKQQSVWTYVKGTLGYLDPEYYTSGKLTEKSDVYSYGVVLLELLTARAPIEHGKYIVKEVKSAIDNGGLRALRAMLDPRIKDEELGKLNSFTFIALSCVEDTAAIRPSMGEVVKQLEELVGHDYPDSGSSNID